MWSYIQNTVELSLLVCPILLFSECPDCCALTTIHYDITLEG